MTDALVTIAISAVVARNLGADAFGSYAFAVATVGFLTIVGQMGVGPLLVRELASRDRKDSPILAAALVVATSAGMLGMLVALVGNAGIASLPPGIDTAGVGFMAILVFSLSLQAAGAEDKWRVSLPAP